MLARFVTAFQFLTVVPLFKARRFDNRELAASMAAFPLVGALLGFAMAALHLAIDFRLPPMFEGALLVALMALLTGAFHLDGVADTADGLGGGYTPERSLEIMKDSRIGALGAVALMLVLLLKTSGYGYLDGKIAVAALIAVPAAARGAVVSLAYRSTYARPTGGLGSPYTEHLDAATLAAALLFGALFCVPLGLAGGIGFAALLLWMGILRVYFNKRLGGITGDVLGFAEETAEIIFLAIIYVIP